MNEIKAIVRAYDRAVAEGKKAALATVVLVEGSSYRQPGARMLITEDGQITGAISGGCLEGDALRKAQLAILQGQNKLVVYDTTGEDEHQFGVQLGCNGIVSILFEPLFPEISTHPIDLLRKVTSSRKAALLLTVFGSDNTRLHPGTCGYKSKAETIWDALLPEMPFHAEVAFQQMKTEVAGAENFNVLYQAIPPPVQLLIAGAGNDAQPVAAMAALLGWEIVVVDGRATHATAQRFPQADRVLVAKADAVLSQVATDAQTAAVLMTHNYNYDLALLEKLLFTTVSYIGILGPKAKTNRLLDAISGKYGPLSKENASRIYGPVGLDIGAEGAAEIALSIVSGIKASFAGRNGEALKYRQSPIHTNA